MRGRSDDAGAMEEHIRRRSLRMDEEMAAGVTFFCGPLELRGWELKMMPDGGIVYVRSQPIGENFTENRVYRLVRLGSWSLSGAKLVIKGDFLYDSGEHIHGIRPGRARPTSRRLTVRGPFEHEEGLADAMCRLASSSAPKGVGAGGVLRGFLGREVAEPAAGIGMAPAVLPGAILGAATHATVTGSVVGFEEVAGGHVPVYTFTDAEGRSHRRAGGQTVEQVLDESAVLRMLNGPLPREVSVTYRRSDPSDSRCDIEALRWRHPVHPSGLSVRAPAWSARGPPARCSSRAPSRTRPRSSSWSAGGLCSSCGSPVATGTEGRTTASC